ncbi:MAG: aminotransferase class III-fold pyridoxal phosphate-dependent enzyme [Bacteroidales bacterium]
MEELERIDETVAAVVIEPIQAEAGILEPVETGLGENFLRRVQEQCRKVGALLIVDEIQTGMGRTGSLLACTRYGVTPDILCLAKSFGGGMPLGAFIAPREFMKKLTFDPPLGHITTFGGHPVCCAAGLAAQRVVEEEGLMEHALRMEQRYRSRLPHPCIQKVRGRGLFLAVVLRDGLDVSQFMARAFREGLVMDQFLFDRGAFRIAPPLTITEAEVDRSVEMIHHALDELWG